ERPRPLGGGGRRGDLGRGGGRRRRRLRWELRAPHRRGRRADGSRPPSLPARALCAGVRERRPAPPARVLPPLRGRAPPRWAMKRAALVAALVLLAPGAARSSASGDVVLIGRGLDRAEASGSLTVDEAIAYRSDLQNAYATL